MQAEHVVGEEKRIFNESEWQEADDERRRKPQPPATPFLGSVDPGRARKRAQRHRKGQPDVSRTPPGIEHRAAGDDQPDPMARGQKEMTGEVDGEENEEDRIGKQHYLVDPSSVFAPSRSTG